MHTITHLIVSIVTIGLLSTSTFTTAQISTLDELIRTLNKTGTNPKVGFMSGANYVSVKRLLPNNVNPVFISHKSDLLQGILNGSIVAGLMTSLPERQWHSQLNFISSTVVSMHAVLMAPDNSSAFPQGVAEEHSTNHLSLAVHAAIARLHALGIDKQLAAKNDPTDIVSAHTCKDHNLNMFPLPNRDEAEGLLKQVLEGGKLIVLGSGPHNWGSNVGNYLVEPPVGFYPDLMQAIVDQMGNLSGPDKQLYGPITIERVYSQDSCFPWHMLFDGSAHVAEPYFIYDGSYYGSCSWCVTDDDCPNAVDLPLRKETCTGGYCRGPLRPVATSFRPTCTVHGTEAKFITKKSAAGSYFDRLQGLIGISFILVLVGIY